MLIIELLVFVTTKVSTSAGWDGVLSGLMNDMPPGCNDTVSEIKHSSDCGNTPLAVVFLVTYLVINFLVVINMYIAVILENFSQATEDVQQGLTQVGQAIPSQHTIQEGVQGHTRSSTPSTLP